MSVTRATLAVLAVLASALAALLGWRYVALSAGWPPVLASALGGAACGLTAGCGVALANRRAARR